VRGVVSVIPGNGGILGQALLFRDQHLDSSGAGDPLIHRACHFGIKLSHDTVHREDPFLEKPGDEREKRDGGADYEGEPPMHKEHRDYHPATVEKRP